MKGECVCVCVPGKRERVEREGEIYPISPMPCTLESFLISFFCSNVTSFSLKFLFVI